MDVLAIRDVQVFLGSLVLGLCVACLSTRRYDPASPAWPVRLYLFVLLLGPAHRYARSRTTFSRREQFVTVFFVWFFIFFVIGVFLFSCGRRACS